MSETEETVAETEETVSFAETCPHCQSRMEGEVSISTLTATCPTCGKVIPLCEKCASLHPESARPCDDCSVCDLANVMNCVRNGRTDEDIEKVLASLTPPLTDMTTGIPEFVDKVTYEDYINDIEPADYERNKSGDVLIDEKGQFTCTREERVRFPDATWDVKYWDCFRILKECILDENSSENDFLEVVSQLREINKA